MSKPYMFVLKKKTLYVHFILYSKNVKDISKIIYIKGKKQTKILKRQKHLNLFFND